MNLITKKKRKWEIPDKCRKFRGYSTLFGILFLWIAMASNVSAQTVTLTTDPEPTKVTTVGTDWSYFTVNINGGYAPGMRIKAVIKGENLDKAELQFETPGVSGSFLPIATPITLPNGPLDYNPMQQVGVGEHDVPYESDAIITFRIKWKDANAGNSYHLVFEVYLIDEAESISDVVHPHISNTLNRQFTLDKNSTSATLYARVDQVVDSHVCTNDGIVYFSVYGGSGNYTSTHNADILDKALFGCLPNAGTFIRVTDNETGQFVDLNAYVGERNYPPITVVVDEIIQPNCTDLGSITFTAGGGNTAAGYTYKIDNLPSADIAPGALQATIDDIVPGNHILSVYGKNCSSIPVKNIYFTINPQPSSQGFADIGAMNYTNGDLIQAINLNALVPEGYLVDWELASTTDFGLGPNGTTGRGLIPTFRAVNTTNAAITAQITFTLKDINGGAIICSAPATRDITILPKTNLDYDLVADTVSNLVICPTDNPSFPLIAKDKGVPVFTNLKFRIEFVSGNNIVTTSSLGDITAASWKPALIANAAGTATFRAVPIYQNREGLPVTFTLEVRPNFGFADVGNLTFTNGDFVQAINLNALAPEGVVVDWVLSNLSAGTNFGLGLNGATGRGIIPAFQAVNTTNASITAEITYSISYINGGQVCSSPATRTITILPKTIDNPNLIADQIPYIAPVCVDATTVNIPLTAKLLGAPENADFRIEYVSGDNVLDLGTNPVSGNPWAAPLSGTTGKGTYRAVPLTAGSAGIGALFTVEVRPNFGFADVGDLTFTNGDFVQAINLNALAPEGVVVDWVITNISAGATDFGLGIVGTTGRGLIPAFQAVNTTDALITATITYSISYINGGAPCSQPAPRTITILPKTIDNPNLIADQIPYIDPVCVDAGTVNIPLTAKLLGAPENADFRIEYVSGDNVLDLSINPVEYATLVANIWAAPLSGTTGTGTYRAVPLTAGSAGIAALFTVEVRPNFGFADVGDLTFTHGDFVQAINLNALVPEGVVVDWVLSNLSAGTNFGLGLNGATGRGIIPAFQAVNTTNALITATITYSISYINGGAPCSQPAPRTITILPANTLAVTANVVNGIICANDNAKFNVAFAATGLGAGSVTYRVEFVSGDEIIAGTFPQTVTSPWEPEATAAGKATYKVFPVNADGEDGYPALFSLESRPNYGFADLSDLEFAPGILVPEISLNTLVPAGAKVVWTNDNTAIGLAASGEGVIPPFTTTNTTAANLVANLTFTLVYADGKGCSGLSTTHTITILPANTLAATVDVVTGIICADDATPFNVVFATVGVGVTPITYRVEFVSGDEIIEGVFPIAVPASPWEPKATAAGKATYKVFPVNADGEDGYPALFSLESRPNYGFADLSDLEYTNGTVVSTINLNAAVPEGATVTWTNNNTAIGLPASGQGFIPQFTATNTTDAPIVATLRFTLVYADGKGCSGLWTEHTIRVLPRTNVDFDLVADPVANQIVCSTVGFAQITFGATDKANNNSAITGDYFRVEFVSGANIIGNIPTGLVANWTPTIITDAIGQATFRVVPVYNNREGVASIFTLEVRPNFGFADVGNLTFTNGDFVQAINLNALAPEGVVVDWVITNISAGATDFGLGIVGTTGRGLIPAFQAVNTTNAPITAEITYSISYINGGPVCSNPATRTITVLPKTNVDFDLVADPVANQIVCATNGFTQIIFGATDKANNNSAITGDYFRVEFVSGANIINNIPTGLVADWTPTIITDAIGQATFRVVPVYNNREGVASIFTLEVRPSYGFADLEEMIFYNGDKVQAINLNTLVPDNAVVLWETNGPDVGFGTKGVGIIPAFTAVNETGAEINFNITFTLHYNDGLGCLSEAIRPVTIKPKTNVDFDLVANSVANQIVCATVGFTQITFGATDKTNTNQPIPAGPYYRVEFVSGANIIGNIPTGLVADWTPTIIANAIGQATFRVVPVYNNREGVASIFTLEVRPSYGFADLEEMIFYNGDKVQAINLNTLVPEGAVVLWSTNGPDVGFGTSGVGIIPAFTAINLGNTDIVFDITYTLHYNDGLGCSPSATRPVTIKPRIIDDTSVSLVTRIHNLRVCPDGDFGTVEFTANRVGKLLGALENLTNEDFYLEIRLTGGENVLNLTDGSKDGWYAQLITPADVSPANNFTFDPAIFASGAIYGSGTYEFRIHVPALLLEESGTADVVSNTTVLTFTRRAPITVYAGLNEDMKFQNGDWIDATYLTFNLPEGIAVKWSYAGDDIGLGTTNSGGVGFIPPFRASNPDATSRTGTFHFKLYYTEDEECSITVDRQIEITPKTHVDYDLIAYANVETSIVCIANAFKIHFGAKDNLLGGSTPVGTKYRIEHVSGVDVIGGEFPIITTSPWQPVSKTEGIGVYRIVPFVDNREGIAATITLEARLPLDYFGTLYIQDLVYKNGDQVEAFNLNALVPENVVVSWVINRSDIGMQGMSGVGIIPAFTATNITNQPIVANIAYTVKYRDGLGCSTVIYKTITILPKTNIDHDLVAVSFTVNPICLGEYFDIDPQEFRALNFGDTISYKNGLTFRYEFYDGIQVVLSEKLPLKGERVGKGTYRVIPIYQNREGEATAVVLEVREPLGDFAGLTEDLHFYNGDWIDNIPLQFNLPEGAVVKWQSTGVDFGLGAAASGIGIIPPFRAVNVTSSIITGSIAFTVQYADGLGCGPLIFIRKIYVHPKTLEDIDLIANPIQTQEVCYDSNFEDIIFSAYRTDAKPGTSAVSYLVEFVEGTDVINLGANPTYKEVPEASKGLWDISKIKDRVSGTGTYRVTPRSLNGEGKSVIFNLIVFPNLNEKIAVISKDFTFYNGDAVPAYQIQSEALPEGVSLSWEEVKDSVAVTTATIPEIGTNGVTVIPAFSAVNTNTDGADIVASYYVYASSGSESVSCRSDKPLAVINITIKPKTIDDIDLVVNPVPSQSICYDEKHFVDVNFSAYRTDNIDLAPVSYIIEFVEGEDIIALGKNESYKEVAESLNGLWKISDIYASPGKGLYRVTPRSANGEGKSVLFTLEMKLELNNEDIDISDMVFYNGDQVPDYKFKGINIPEGASFLWKWTSGDVVGTVTEGVDRIPAFEAVNTTARPLEAIYQVWLQLDNQCSSALTAKEFKITVYPQTVDDYDFSIIPVPSQIICYNDQFTDITLTAQHRFNSQFNDPTNFQWELISGKDILGLGTTNVITSNNNVSSWVISNSQKTVGSATYRITPIWNSNRGVSTVFTLTRLPAAEIDPVNNVVLCNNSELPRIIFTGTDNTLFKWQVVDASGEPTTSKLGLGSFGTNEIYRAKLVNNTGVHITETIQVTPYLKNENCIGTPITFTITVLPTPVANSISNLVVENGKNVDAIQFTGTGITTFRWASVDAAFNIANGTVSSGEGNEFPSFTAVNINDEPLSGKITVTPIYKYNDENGIPFICEGAPIEFFIIIAPTPYIDQISDIRVCEGESTPAITPTGLPTGSGYHIQWEVNENVGLASYIFDRTANLTKEKSIPGLKPARIYPEQLNEPSVATIKVTPLLTIGYETFAGNPVYFNISVIPTTRLVEGYETEKIEPVATCAKELVVLDMDATGYNLNYQWYKDNVAISGANKKSYDFEANGVDNAGKYYAIVTGECSAVQGKTYEVKIKPNVVYQRWNDVLTLNTNPNENGGFKFVQYQWYEIDGNGEAIKLPFQTLSYLYVEGGLHLYSQYFVEAITDDGYVFQSCPVVPTEYQTPSISVAPNPVKAGEVLHVDATLDPQDLNETTYQLVDLTNRVVIVTKATGERTDIRVPNVKGIYILRVLVKNDSKSFKIIVE